VTLKITDVPEPGMAAYDFKITFTPGVIEFGTSKSGHEWPDPDYGTPFTFKVDNAAGHISFNDVFTDTPAPSGDITLAVLHGTATATESAATALHFEKADIKDPDGAPILATVTDGQVVVTPPTKVVDLTAPGPIDLGEMVQGNNAGNSAGSVVSNVDGWTLTVEDAKKVNPGYMTTAEDVKLSTAIEVGMEASSLGTISEYQTALRTATGYGEDGTFAIPLFVNQVIIPTDASGTYSITLTYTVTLP
jgi:hypothetical protein